MGKKEKAIAQEDLYGCALACVAKITNRNYKKALNLFAGGKIKTQTKGFWCRDIIKALAKAKIHCQYKYFKRKLKPFLYKEGTIVFLRNKNMPQGHYLVRTVKGWMDSWINFPNIKVKAGFRKRLPGKPMYIIFRKCEDE